MYEKHKKTLSKYLLKGGTDGVNRETLKELRKLARGQQHTKKCKDGSVKTWKYSILEYYVEFIKKRGVKQ